MATERGRYRFRSRWRVEGAPARVYEALRDVAAYPRWWPEVRAARELAPGRGELRCRSLLPYELTFVVTRVIEDPVSGVLAATLSGDLVGSGEWRLYAEPGGATVVRFDEDVVVVKAAVRAAGALARPVLRYNHERMMRSGERGLRRHLTAGA